MKTPQYSPIRGPILRFLADVADASTAQICGATKIDSVSVRNALADLVGAEHIQRTGVTPRHRFAITAAGREVLAKLPAGPVKGRSLPIASRMLSGPGEQRSTCRRLDACRDAFARTPGSGAAHCPRACSGYEAAERTEPRATDYARSGRAAGGAW